jgi:AAA+ superfamily predicted ATPase
MEATSNSVNVESIENELEWLGILIEKAISKHTENVIHPPSLSEKSAYYKLIKEFHLNDTDRVLMALSFSTVLMPSVFTPFILKLTDVSLRNRFGGVFLQESGEFIPTIRTAVFLLAADDAEKTIYYLKYFHSRNKLFKSGLVKTFEHDSSYNFSCRLISFNDQFLGTLSFGEAPSLDGDTGFPARRVKRLHSMKDVVLDEKTISELEKLRRFARNMKKLWHLPEGEKYRQNFIGIFSGDPGTGKSHTAEAIGNELNLPVYKVNFAQLASKYIGETEKNLERVFDRFSGHPSILFFDEAESIFSKRIEVKDSHDKHANNEQSYLLQKIEEYNGIVILATNVQNLSQYFDKAFQRRIRQIINFSFPEYPERLRLWKNALGLPFTYEEGLTERLARNYQLSGGGIYNIISEAVIEALDRDMSRISFEMLEPALKDEFKKTGRKFETCTDEMVKQEPARRYGPGYEQRKNF